MKSHGKMRWIEKTPDHLMHTDKIRTHFPDAPIIRIRRDPRDVALSLVNVPWGPETFLEALTYFFKYQDVVDDFFTVDHNSYTVRYEDLVSSPESELQNICEFLQESFEPSMLDTKQAAADVKIANESWKEKTAEQVDKSRANAWTTILTAEQKRQADAIIGGYTDERDALAKTLPIFIRIAGYTYTTDRNGCDLLSRMIQDSNVRFWPATADERPLGTVFIGDPGSGEWLGYGSQWERLRSALAISGTIVKHRLRGHPYAWPWMADADWSNHGFCSTLIAIAVGGNKDII
jgi:hypothetical protein